MARIRQNKNGELVLTLSVYEARMAGDALAETIQRHHLTPDGGTATVLRAIDRGLKRHAERKAEG
jgi:hypothetical protein